MVKFENVNNTTFQNNLLNGTQAYAFEIGLSHNLTLRNNHVISEYKSLSLNNPKAMILENNIFDGEVDYFMFPTLPDDGATLDLSGKITNVYSTSFSYSWNGGEIIENATEIQVPSTETKHYLWLEIKDDFGNIIRENRTYVVLSSGIFITALNPTTISDESPGNIAFIIPNLALIAYGVILNSKRKFNRINEL